MMKTFKSIMYIAAAAMAFTACNVEPIEAPEETVGTHTVTFVASQLDTKTTMDINNGVASFDWEEADVDYFHIFENEYSKKATEYAADIDENGAMQLMATFENGGTAPFTYFGFFAPTFFNYPQVPAAQTDNGKYDPKADILIAKPVTADASQSEEILSFQFKRIVAINVMTLKGLTAGETVSEVKIVSDKPIAGKYDHVNEKWYNSTDMQITVSANSVVDENGNAVIYFVSAPVEEAQLTITATTAAGKTYSKQLAKTITFSEGGVKTFGVTVENATPVEESYIELTNDEIGDMASSYAGGTIHNSYGDWSYNACKQSRDGYTFMQIRNNETVSFIQIPEVAGDITRIVLSDVCNGSNGKYTGDVYFRTNKSNSADVIAQSNSATKAFDELTIELPNSYSTGYVMSSGPCRFTKIRVYYSTIKKTALATPTNLAVTNKVITWDAVANAGSYLVTIGANDPVGANTNSYDATAIDDEYYDVSVVAVPSNTDTYKKSAPAVLEGVKFGDPWLTQPTLSAGAIDESSITVTWTYDPRATNGYEAIIYKDLGDGTLGSLTTTDHDQMNIMTGSATFTGLEEGQAYEIRVMAMNVNEPRAYHFSSNGTINLATKPAQHVSNITAAGTYTIKGLTVFAENISSKSANIIAGDSTGYVLVYVNGTSNIPAVGSTMNVFGTVKVYNGVYEFDNPTITNVIPGTAVYGTPIELDEEGLDAYSTESYIDYVTVKGYKQPSGYDMTVGEETVNIYGSTTGFDGKYITATGFVFGYNNGKTNLMLVDIEEDTTVPTLSIDKNSKVWAWDNTDPFVVNVSANAGSWTISPETLDWATVAVDATAGTITVTPKGQNASDADYEATLTVSHSVVATLTKTITIKQEKESEGGQGTVIPSGTVLWAESFDHFGTKTPSAAGTGSGTTIYGGATITYSQSSTNTKGYDEQLAGGTAPELLLSKSNQTWTISGICCNGASKMSLTFLANKTTFSVTSSTDGISVTGSQKSWAIENNGAKTFEITIKNTGSGNARIDDVILEVN